MCLNEDTILQSGFKECVLCGKPFKTPSAYDMHQSCERKLNGQERRGEQIGQQLLHQVEGKTPIESYKNTETGAIIDRFNIQREDNERRYIQANGGNKQDLARTIEFPRVFTQHK